MSIPTFIRETAESVFGNKEMLPLNVFTRRMGMDRKTILNLVGSNLLDVFEYRPGTYRKMLVSKVSFIRFLKATSLRRIDSR